ncbi:MAG: hypothetical protein A3F84_28745 [Candidatus Handelsmanbacteria bacterium RIFCSPLOWO2_12_FULL_64_10]|uniref:histidine kinase n=1 Tax=Handelsmanbacteria sp. (strain RIFCSPLOWO2_12_FULL_64_10) TaxID=1817868 RepID=A0A1F6CB92_HANXR|nr:MAG: hypothetical protein A3F84_28745 [Candidatus Handelsmanbacteria bacterium RIFCSPLOWO2_12_FULL_64_10]
MQPLGAIHSTTLPEVLVVDDERGLRIAICEMLGTHGYEAVGTGSAEEALQILQGQDFDIVLTDLMMPGMDGIAFLKAALGTDPQLVAIMMTGQGTVETAVEAMRIGAFDYVMKPFRSATLLPIVERALEVRRLRVENAELRDTLAMRALSEAIGFTLDHRVILDKMADAAVAQCDADEATILLPTGSGNDLYVAAVRGQGRSHLLGEKIPSNQGIAGWVAHNQEGVTLLGAVNDSRFTPVHPRGDILAAISMPMLVAGKFVGILNVNSLRRRAFRLGQIRGLSILVSTGAAALQHGLLYADILESQEQHRLTAERLQTMNDFAHTVGGTLDLDSILQALVGEVPHALSCGWCAVVKHLPAEGAFSVRAAWSQRAALTAAGATASGASASEMVLDTGSYYFAQDTRDSGIPPLVGLPLQAVSSYLSVPIRVDDMFWGTLDVGFDEPGAVSQDRIEFLEAVASHLSAAIRNADLHSRLRDAFDEIKVAQAQIVQQERLSALGQMASGIAHDFNNTLAPILGFSELLLDSLEGLDEKSRGYLEVIRTAAGDAAGVVRRLREFYRPNDAGEEFETIDLNGVVEQTLLLTQPRWKDQMLGGGKALRVESDLEPRATVLGSGSQLREALMNVILNAVDALSEGGHITVSTHSEERGVLLEVRDTGPGMSEEVRSRCLEPFFSTKGTRGTGLGLPMVYGVVQRHHGSLDIASEIGVGTTVRIWLPSASESVPARERRTAPDAEGPLRILVVDDEPAVREFVAASLVADGHYVETADDGSDGLQRFHSGQFDLVLTDRAMPRMNGDQLAAAVKAASPQTPVILLTGFGDLMEPLGDRPAGVDLVLSKPVGLRALREGVVQAAALYRQDPTSS